MVVVELDQNILEVELYLVVLEVEVMVLSSQVQIGKVLRVLLTQVVVAAQVVSAHAAVTVLRRKSLQPRRRPRRHSRRRYF